MEPNLIGIKNSQEIILFIHELAKTFKEANQNGSIDLLDALKSISLMPYFLNAIKDSDQILDELMNLSEHEKDTLLLSLKKAICELIKAFS